MTPVLALDQARAIVAAAALLASVGIRLRPVPPRPAAEAASPRNCEARARGSKYDQ